MLEFKLENVVDTGSLDKLADLYEHINEKRLTVKDTGINYRVINHWDKQGLIRFGRHNKEANRKFSFVDFIWIKVVNELRSFGVQLPVIKRIASEIYEPLPISEIMDHLAQHPQALNQLASEHHVAFVEFIKSGDYKSEEFKSIKQEFSYLQILVIEAITASNIVSLIIFDDGDWFPFIKSQEHNYPKNLITKKETRSQVRISLTEIVYRYIVLDAFKNYSDVFGIFNSTEARLLTHIKEGDYKKLIVLFKARKREPLEINKSKTALAEIANLIREGEYREFILTDKKGNEFRVRGNTPEEDAAQLKKREEAFAELAPIIEEHKRKIGKAKNVKGKA